MWMIQILLALTGKQEDKYINKQAEQGYSDLFT